MATNHSQSPAVVLRERRGKTAGWTTKQRRSDRSTTLETTEKKFAACSLVEIQISAPAEHRSEPFPSLCSVS